MTKVEILLVLISTASILISMCSVAHAQSGMMDPELMSLYEGSGINPFDAAATNNLAMKLIRKGKYERASKLLQRAARLAPRRKNIRRNIEQLKVIMSQMRDLDVNTAQDFRRSFTPQEVPFVPEPWGLEDKALAEAETLVEPEIDDISLSGNPFDAHSLVAVADVKMRRDDYRGALEALLRAKQLSPWLTEIDDRIRYLRTQVVGVNGSSLANAVASPALQGANEGRSGDSSRTNGSTLSTDIADQPPAPWVLPENTEEVNNQ